jgi:hypothetical protein
MPDTDFIFGFFGNVKPNSVRLCDELSDKAGAWPRAWRGRPAASA